MQCPQAFKMEGYYGGQLTCSFSVTFSKKLNAAFSICCLLIMIKFVKMLEFIFINIESYTIIIFVQLVYLISKKRTIIKMQFQVVLRVNSFCPFGDVIL